MHILCLTYACKSTKLVNFVASYIKRLLYKIAKYISTWTMFVNIKKYIIRRVGALFEHKN